MVVHRRDLSMPYLVASEHSKAHQPCNPADTLRKRPAPAYSRSSAEVRLPRERRKALVRRSASQPLPRERERHQNPAPRQMAAQVPEVPCPSAPAVQPSPLAPSAADVAAAGHPWSARRTLRGKVPCPPSQASSGRDDISAGDLRRSLLSDLALP